MGNLELTIITLNVNGMNSPIKQKQIAEWIRKENPTICCPKETHKTGRHMSHEGERLEQNLLGFN